MKRNGCILLLAVLLGACAPVLDRAIMRQASREVPFGLLQEEPSAFTGKVYAVGGVIVSTKFTEAGSRIEALYVPVTSLGYLKEGMAAAGRYRAVFPRSKGFLDPVIFAKGRAVTLAGTFRGVVTDKLDEIEYRYPVFDIIDLYLWEEIAEQPYPPSYYYPVYPYWWYDPWWRPYPPGWYWPPPRW